MNEPGTTNLSERDFFTEEALVADPYPYFESLRATCPVYREPHHGVYAVTGHEEALQVYQHPDMFSACNAPTGPFPGLSVPPGLDDVSDLIEQARDHLPMGHELPTLDPPEHTRARGLMLRLLTPGRLKENEEYIGELADQLLDAVAPRGRFEFVAEFADPFAFLVIADLLGVPEGDRQRLHEAFRARTQKAGSLTKEGRLTKANPQQYLHDAFTGYVEDRRREPRDDVLTGMANATYPDGTLPPVMEVVRTAAFLFAAGQETTVRLLAFCLQALGERPELQKLLRMEPDRIPNFVEEMLRLESPIKSTFRLARRSTSIDGVDVPAGSCVMFLHGAMNRDPRRFDEPHELDVNRPNARHHLSFGQGIHTCPGAPLARAEARIGVTRLLERLRDIRISEAEHGPPGARRYEYVPTYMFRGLQQLHLEFALDDLSDV